MLHHRPAVNDQQIRALRAEAFAAGDAHQGYICHLALLDEHTEAELTDAGWHNDNTCLDAYEVREMTCLTQADARRICERVINGTADERLRAEESYRSED